MAQGDFYMKQSLTNGIFIMKKCGVSQIVECKKPSKNTRLFMSMNSCEF